MIGIEDRLARVLTSAVMGRSLSGLGDGARLRRVLASARDGRATTIGVIGGSITQGASATAPRLRYADRFAAWFGSKYPGSAVRLINAGRGATGSNYAALRARRDLLDQRPDLVVLEFAVNDGVEPSFGETYEGLLRQILLEPNHPAAITIFMMHRGGRNAQERLGAVASHYRIPMTSYRDALQPEIDAGRLPWDDISPDEVHPNDFGHACAARFLVNLLEQAEQGASDDDPPVPPPLYSDQFQRTTLLEAPAARPVASAGWSLDAHGDPWPYWRANEPGSTIEFEISGRTILLMHYRIRGDAGIATAQVDECPAVTLDAWFPGTWGGYRETVTLARDLAPGLHRVRLTLSERRNPESAGHEFRILGLGAAGVE